MKELEMFKVTYQAGKNSVEIIQVSKKVGDNWELLKDPTLTEALENKILKGSLPHKHSERMGYGEAIYNQHLRYITGSYEVI